jgi:hypothetical protein
MEAIGKVRDLNRSVCRYSFETELIEGVALRPYFADIEGHVIEHIRIADAIVGCVAWLTSPSILRALALVPRGVSIIVQKEDFLRPDLGQHDCDSWRSDLRTRYEALRRLQCWPGTLNIAAHASIEDLWIQPVRCVGMARQGSSTQPRMHHKFIVFCNQAADSYAGGTGGSETLHWPEPYAVWTGSFNFTVNGCNSLENALFINDKRIAKLYYEEWQTVAWLSESLDWSSRWVDQEWSVT